MFDTKVAHWEHCYQQRQNHIFYPKEECVKFVNRYVIKRTGINEFERRLPGNGPLTGLDYGCGIGANTQMLSDFGIESTGVDISKEAIKTARACHSHIADRFHVVEGNTIPFADNHFDLVVCDSVLDSMTFPLAQEVMMEIARVCRHIAYINVISGMEKAENDTYDGEEIVQSQHELGTIQSYFNWAKIEALLKDTEFHIAHSYLIREMLLQGSGYTTARYHLVVKK